MLLGRAGVSRRFFRQRLTPSYHSKGCTWCWPAGRTAGPADRDIAVLDDTPRADQGSRIVRDPREAGLTSGPRVPTP